MEKRKEYRKEEVQMIIDNYDHNMSMTKNAQIFGDLLDRNTHAVLNKLNKLKSQGLLVISKETVEVAPSENFMFTVLHLALARIDKAEKQKLIIKLMSQV